MVWSPIRTLLIGAGLVGLSAAADPWGYHEDSAVQLGPSRWSEVNPACGGGHQSPINLVYKGEDIVNLWGTTKVAPLKFHGDCENFNLKTLEDLYKWEFSGDSACKVSLTLEDGKTYTLAQFHVHTKSEHTIYGHHYSGEIHFVHKEDGGSGLLVTGLLLSVKPEAEENGWIENVWRSMDEGNESGPVPVNLSLNYVDLLNAVVAQSHLFNYPGSLTTPPCSEIVNWWVINNPLHITPREYERLAAKYEDRPAADHGHDNRPTQPLNGRKVLYY